MKKFFLVIFYFFYFANPSVALIEVDITRGNLEPLPIAVSPLYLEPGSQEIQQGEEQQQGREPQQAGEQGEQQARGSVLTSSTILKKNLSIRHNVFPTHSLSELVILKELYPDKINLFGAYLENEMIAGVINFIVNERVVLAFYIILRQGHSLCMISIKHTHAHVFSLNNM